MLGDHAGAADVIDLLVEQDADRRRLGLAADHGGIGEGIDDDVADHMDAAAAERIEHAPHLVEGEVGALHQHHQLLDAQRRRRRFDQLARGEHIVAGREDDLAAVAADHLKLLLRLQRQAARLVLVALGEDVGLDQRQVLQRRRLGIDDHVIDDFEGGEIDRAQVLRHVRPIAPLQDVVVGGQTGDENVGLALGVEQMPQMPRMDDVEHAMAHDHLALARRVADERRNFLRCLDLVLVVAAEEFHDLRPPSPDTQTTSWWRPRSTAGPTAAHRARARCPPSCA